MTTDYSVEDQTFISESIDRFQEELIAKILTQIEDTELLVREHLKKRIANDDHPSFEYYCAFVLGRLFDRLHRGDKQLGELILTMEAKRLGLPSHVD